MIRDWRTIFRQGNLPFYFVQLPPFSRNYFLTHLKGSDITSYDVAEFREAQSKVRGIVANTEMAVLMDQNEVWNIHSSRKKVIGERLALFALKNMESNV